MTGDGEYDMIDAEEEARWHEKHQTVVSKKVGNMEVVTTTTEWAVREIEELRSDNRRLYAHNRGVMKHNRKLTDQLNRIRKLIPGASRVWRLHEVAVFIQADAEAMQEEHGVPVDRIADDVLFLERLAYDLESMRIAEGRGVRGGGNSKYDPTQWPRGERP